ncbi:hypothetical protein E4P39_02305 [Blastococcus sp. CT_GayMR19]|uniref:hypothetical protein n=1 Tax=Blastococcus sp. CT_GayMR19 TaxID=2559608 RepID=UPI001073A543|nr:hypothetical protein [Blastococcus sp. CT_GayMR19]TFV79481.1 hypothetical protein E4P39_02305 [Blastococcus sp. CT_GayMR19]
MAVGALVAGLVLGGATGASMALALSDPTRSDEYRGLQAQVDFLQGEAQELEDRARRADGRATSAEASASSAVASADSRQAALDQREQDIAGREQAVAAVEQRIAATSIDEGTWTVGRDVEPGTYTTAQAVTGDCYWAITRSGTNGGDIVRNDIVKGGFPTVTLSAGQDFTNNRCGTFVKQ